MTTTWTTWGTVDVNEDEENNAENKAPYGGDLSYSVQHHYDENQKQQHHYDQTEQPIVLELTQPKEPETMTLGNGFTHPTNTPQAAVAAQAVPTTCAINNERSGSCYRTSTANTACCDEEAVLDRNAGSSSICSSDSNGSISSCSSLAKEEERSAATNQQKACATDDGGLEPASETIVIVVQQHPPHAHSSTDTHSDTNQSNGRPNRTSVSSDFFCLSADSDSMASSCDTTASVCTEPATSPTPPPPLPSLTADSQQPPPHNHLTETRLDKVRDDLRKLSDLLKLSLTNVKALDDGVDTTVEDTPVMTLPSSPAPALELDSELESLKSKVNTIRTSRAQNKLNELAQRPDFLANDTFKLPTFRFLPKSISLCNEDSVFKENYTKFCDRNATSRLSREESQETTVTEKVDTAGTVVRKKSTTTKKKKDAESAASTTTTTTTTTTFASTASGRIASTTTVRKTIVKQQKVVLEDASSTAPTSTITTESRRSVAPTKSFDVPAPDTKLTHSASIKRTKFRVNQLSSRDVPVAINSVARRYLERSGVQDDLTAASARVPPPTNVVQTTLDDTVTANNMRNNAIRLRSSVSVDWDAVENRSMKTINTILKRHAVASSAVKQIQAQLEASITTHK
uniref:Uncharacterized protein n=1 Tax=Anopheles maculatus TaxID=74869 RepID=A0A182T0P5_9DIPT